MKITAKQLRALGMALYGDEWKTAMADTLGVSDRTIRRYEERGGVALEPPSVRALKCEIEAKIDVLLIQFEFLKRGGP